MTSNWSEYLLTKGACAADFGVAHFGDPDAELAAAREGCVLADLSDWGLLALSGEEAHDFLHNQITNDLRDLAPEHAVFAGYCSPKGRLLANFLVLRHGEDLLMLLPAALLESVRKRLTMFILRARVSVRDASGEWVRLGLSGPGADARLAEATGLSPAAGPMRVARSEDCIAVRLGPERFDLLVRPMQAPVLWERLAGQARPVGSRAWNWLLTTSGIPVILPATQDHFVPQMTNMEVLHGVSFHKGCYPGQEIVARTQFLGKLKRRMFLAHVEAEAKPGDEVYSPVLPDQVAGTVVNAAPAPAGGYDLLVVLRLDCRDDDQVHLGAPGGARLQFQPMPYAL
jgi:hypothetical protein